MKKMALIVTCFLALFLATGTLYAQPKFKGEGRWGEKQDRMAKELNLTQEQQSQLQENRKAQYEQRVGLYKAIKEKEMKLREALTNPAVTRGSVEGLANEIKSLQAQLIDARMNSIFTAKEVLTPEQFAKFQAMTEEHQGSRRGRFSNWIEKMRDFKHSNRR
jgi:Spy/CpxP family protein refolding chaperone